MGDRPILPAVLLDRMAAAIDQVDCEHIADLVEGSTCPPCFARAAAAALLDGCEVHEEREHRRDGWTLPADTFPRFATATHRRLLITTPAEPVEEGTDGR